MNVGRAIWRGYLFVSVTFPLTAVSLPVVALALPWSLLVSSRTGRPHREVQPFRYVDRVLSSRDYRVNDGNTPQVLTSGDVHDPPLAALLMYSDMTPLQFVFIFLFGAPYRIRKANRDAWQLEWAQDARGHALPLRLFVLLTAVGVPASVVLPGLLAAMMGSAS